LCLLRAKKKETAVYVRERLRRKDHSSLRKLVDEHSVS
jgi:hypothetical protein